MDIQRMIQNDTNDYPMGYTNDYPMGYTNDYPMGYTDMKLHIIHHTSYKGHVNFMSFPLIFIVFFIVLFLCIIQ